MHLASFGQRIFKRYFEAPIHSYTRIQIVNTGNLHFEAKPFGKYKMKKIKHTHKFRETINHCALNIRMYRNETY